jgi:hypothetical protein
MQPFEQKRRKMEGKGGFGCIICNPDLESPVKGEFGCIICNPDLESPVKGGFSCTMCNSDIESCAKKGVRRRKCNKKHRNGFHCRHLRSESDPLTSETRAMLDWSSGYAGTLAAVILIYQHSMISITSLQRRCCGKEIITLSHQAVLSASPRHADSRPAPSIHSHWR